MKRRGRPAPRIERIIFGVVLLVAIVILFGRLGAAPLTDFDEGAFSEASREMLARGELVSPWLFDQPRVDTPPFFHWIQMSAMRVIGLDALAARLPSALAGLAWVLVIAAWSWSLGGRDLVSAAFGASIASTSLFLPLFARMATPDATFDALLALTFLACWHALVARNDPIARRWGRAAAVVVALGLLTKGPLALLLPAIALPLAAWWMQRGKRLLWLLSDPIAWLLLVMLALPWYLLQWRALGMRFIDGYFGEHQIGRFLSPMPDAEPGAWYFPVVLLLALLPWTPLAVRGGVDAVRDAGHPIRDRTFGLTWIPLVLVLLVFSFSATKLPNHLNAGLSGVLAVLGVLAAIAHRDGHRFGAVRGLCAVLLVACASLPWWWSHAAVLFGDVTRQQALRDVGIVLGGQRLWLAGLGLAGLVIVLAAPVRMAMIGGASILAVLLHLLIVPAVFIGMQDPLVAAGERVSGLKGRVITWRLDAPSLSFSARRIVPPGEPGIGDTVVLRADQRDALAFALGAGRPRAMLRMQWRMGGIEIAEVVSAR